MSTTKQSCKNNWRT